MKVNYIGRKDLNFNTKDGSHIEGLRLYVVYDDEHVEGQVAEQMFCNISRAEYKALKEADLPCVLDVAFNRYGKADSFTVVKK